MCLSPPYYVPHFPVHSKAIQYFLTLLSTPRGPPARKSSHCPSRFAFPCTVVRLFRFQRSLRITFRESVVGSCMPADTGTAVIWDFPRHPGIVSQGCWDAVCPRSSLLPQLFAAASLPMSGCCTIVQQQQVLPVQSVHIGVKIQVKACEPPPGAAQPFCRVVPALAAAVGAASRRSCIFFIRQSWLLLEEQPPAAVASFLFGPAVRSSFFKSYLIAIPKMIRTFSIVNQF